jgi:type I restriction-modification system DNA methylase subunit
LLANHTLEAVLSMPDELFFNSKVNVVACVVVMTAHKPHPKSKTTYFGYYKNDGFVKRKILGRIDAYGRWASIKDIWLDGYINRSAKPGFSVNKIVKADDEWCAEAYMETDYSTLSQADYDRTVKNYLMFNLMNEVKDDNGYVAGGEE